MRKKEPAKNQNNAEEELVLKLNSNMSIFSSGWRSSEQPSSGTSASQALFSLLFFSQNRENLLQNVLSYV